MASIRVAQAGLQLTLVKTGAAALVATSVMSAGGSTSSAPKVRVGQTGLTLVPSQGKVRLSQAKMQLPAFTPPLKSGVAAFVATSQLSAAGYTPILGWQMGFTAGFADPPPPTVFGTADFVAGSSLTVAGSVLRVGVAPLTAASTMTVTAFGIGNLQGVAAFTAASTLVANAAVTVVGVVALVADSTLGAAPKTQVVSGHSGTAVLTSTLITTATVTSSVVSDALITSGSG